MAFLEDIAVRIGLDPAGLRAGVRASLKELNDLKKATNEIGDGLDKIGEGFKKFGETVAVFTGAVTGLALGVFELTKASSEAAANAKLSAAALGLTVEQYGRLSFAAKEAGVQQDEFGTAFSHFNKLLVAAQAGDEAALKVFENLSVRLFEGKKVLGQYNVQLFDTKGRTETAAQVLDQVAFMFSKVSDGSRKSTNAIELFGRAGASMVPVLNQGSRGLRELGDEGARLGQVFSARGALIGTEFKTSVDHARDAMTGLRNAIALAIAPDLTRVFNGFTEDVVKHRKEVILLALEGYVFLRNTVLDFVAVFEGRDADVSQQWVLTLRDNVKVAGAEIKRIFEDDVIPIFNLVKAVLTDVANAINETFGTNLNATDVAVGIFAAKMLGFFSALTGAIQIASALIPPFIKLLGLIGDAFLFLARPAVLAALRLLQVAIAAAMAPLVALVGFPAAVAIGIGLAVVALLPFWKDITDAATATYNFIVNLFKGIVSVVGGAVSAAYRIATGTVAPAPADVPASGTIPGHAAGGLIRGAGSMTSDSNIIAVSDYEYVVRGAAVKKFGVGLFDALNAGMLPKFASGGLVGAGGVPVNLVLPGGTFPMQASSSVVESLTRHVRAASRRKPGIAPSWQR